MSSMEPGGAQIPIRSEYSHRDVVSALDLRCGDLVWRKRTQVNSSQNKNEQSLGLGKNAALLVSPHVFYTLRARGTSFPSARKWGGCAGSQRVTPFISARF